MFRKNFGETGSVKYYEILIPKQTVNEVLRSQNNNCLQGSPKKAQLIREWVMSCEQCIRESRIDRSLTRRPLQNPNEHITAPENAMQIDLVPEIPPFGGYKNIVTAMDVFPAIYLQIRHQFKTPKQLLKW